MFVDSSPPPLSLVQLFLKFLRFGCLAFGGPVAQIAMVRQALVEEERWISPARFNRLLAVMQVLPGPEAHELCVHLGMVARGRIGGFLAGLGFMLPGLVLMLGTAWAYTRWIAGVPGMAGLLFGVQIVALALIARAVWRIGQHIIDGWAAGLIAAGALLLTLAGAPFWVTLIAAGAVAGFWTRWPLVLLAGVLAAFLALVAGDIGGTFFVQDAATQAGLVALFFAGLKGGLLTFGGAYTAIPYVRADTVGRGWLSDGAFLDGVAFAGVLPAPLVIFATFAGYVAAGWMGALAITAGMFLPAFSFSIIFFERLEAVIENPALHRLLEGVAAAVVGVITATLIQLGNAAVARTASLPVALLIFGVASLIIWRGRSKYLPPLLVILGGAAGWALTP